MKSFDELKIKMKAILHQIFETKKNIFANALNEVKYFCKEFSFTIVMLEVPLAEGLKKK